MNTEIDTVLFGPVQEAEATQTVQVTIAQQFRRRTSRVFAEIAQQFRRRFTNAANADVSTTLFGLEQEGLTQVFNPVPEVPYHSGINEPRILRPSPPIHPGELEFFRRRDYGRNVDALVPPPVVARHNLTTRYFPHSRPVTVPTPPRRK